MACTSSALARAQIVAAEECDARHAEKCNLAPTLCPQQAVTNERLTSAGVRKGPTLLWAPNFDK